MIIPHGKYINPHALDAPPSEPNEDALNGVVANYSRRASASVNVSAFYNLSAIYPDAIAVRTASATANTRGAGLLFPLIAFSPLVFVGPMMLQETIAAFTEFRWFFMLMYPFLWLLLLFVFVPLGWRYMRIDLFPVEDEPIIFDRKRRKVYRLVPPLDGSSERGWRRFFGAIPLVALEYDWDRIDVEHRVQVSGTASSVNRIHYLMLVVRDKPTKDNPFGRVLDEFSVGSSGGVGGPMVAMWWEHLRRYMENNGPALPPDESLQAMPRPRNLWQSIGAVGPFGPRFMWWWNNSRGVLIFYLLLFPLTLPFNILWGICNRISFATMRRVIWPKELIDRLGKPIQKAD